MKKSYLNNAINIALTGIVLSSLILQTRANASELEVEHNADSSNTDTTETYLYPGMGVGAATGTLIAGPVGFIVGGAIGALVGINHEIETEQQEVNDSELASNTTQEDLVIDDNTDALSHSNENKIPITENHATDTPLQVAQIGSLNAVITNEAEAPQEELMNILVSDLSLDVYFRSGSTDIEKFYPARLTAIANLVNSMDKLELHLDGYTDRRGNKEQNIALANTRIERVREQLIGAGVDPERIVSKAFGEAKMKSAAGNLEAYTFDRRVVIRFERISQPNKSMDTASIDSESTDYLTTDKESGLDETSTNENITSETVSDKTNSDLPLAETSDIDQNAAEITGSEITGSESAGFVTVVPVAGSKTVQTPALEETNPTVADATNRF